MLTYKHTKNLQKITEAEQKLADESAAQTPYNQSPPIRFKKVITVAYLDSKQRLPESVRNTPEHINFIAKAELEARALMKFENGLKASEAKASRSKRYNRKFKTYKKS